MIETIMIGVCIGLGWSVVYVFNIWYFSARHWDKYGHIKYDKRMKR